MDSPGEVRVHGEDRVGLLELSRGQVERTGRTPRRDRPRRRGGPGGRSSRRCWCGTPRAKLLMRYNLLVVAWETRGMPGAGAVREDPLQARHGLIERHLEAAGRCCPSGARAARARGWADRSVANRRARTGRRGCAGPPSAPTVQISSSCCCRHAAATRSSCTPTRRLGAPRPGFSNGFGSRWRRSGRPHAVCRRRCRKSAAALSSEGRTSCRSRAARTRARDLDQVGAQPHATCRTDALVGSSSMKGCASRRRTS